MIQRPDGGHRLVFIEVPETKQVKSRLHFDLRPTFGDNGAFSGMLKYFIGNQLVGENHAILDPYSVSFKGGLGD